MPKSVILTEFSELLSHAETVGYHWNQAHDILVRDKICPMYEINKREWYKSDFESNAYGHSDDTLKIMISFFEKHNLKEITVVND